MNWKNVSMAEAILFSKNKEIINKRFLPDIPNRKSPKSVLFSDGTVLAIDIGGTRQSEVFMDDFFWNGPEFWIGTP